MSVTSDASKRAASPFHEDDKRNFAALPAFSRGAPERPPRKRMNAALHNRSWALDLRGTAKSTLQAYLKATPADTKALAPLTWLLTRDGGDVFHRGNMNGHVTASALVLDPSCEFVLMIRHPTVGQLLQPGGHVEQGSPSLWDAAMAEVVQETGVRDVQPIRMNSLATQLPLDIDSHEVPVNLAKGEEAHFHHDFLYLAQASSRPAPAPEEEDAVKTALWLPRGELHQLPNERVRRVAAKLDRLLPLDRMELDDVVERHFDSRQCIALGRLSQTPAIAYRLAGQSTAVDIQTYADETLARSEFQALKDGTLSAEQIFDCVVPSRARRPSP